MPQQFVSRQPVTNHSTVVITIWAFFSTCGKHTVSTQTTSQRGTVTAIDEKPDIELRVLVISENPKLGDDMGRALRHWSHHVVSTVDWADAVDMAADFMPAVVCAPLPTRVTEKAHCRVLRARHADAPMIGYAKDGAARNSMLRTGIVDIAVRPSELSGPSVNGLLQQAIILRRSFAGENTDWDSRIAPHLCRSRMVGLLVTTAAGVVQWANPSMAKWLGYPNASYLVGTNFANRHLKQSSEWTTLAEATGNEKALIQAEVSALDVDGRWIALKLEVSAEPSCLTLLRLVVMDETELQLYKATAELAYQKAADAQKVVQ